MATGFLPITMNLGAKRKPLRGITNQLIMTFYAKQTQFAGHSNERKYC
jgi:hypothetical protein